MVSRGRPEQSFMDNENVHDYVAHVADGIDIELDVDGV